MPNTSEINDFDRPFGLQAYMCNIILTIIDIFPIEFEQFEREWELVRSWPLNRVAVTGFFSALSSYYSRKRQW